MSTIVTLTKDDVERVWKEFEAYEKAIPGLRCGESYPQFALALLGSSALKSLNVVATLSGLVNLTKLPKHEPDGAPSNEEIDRFMENSMSKDVLLRAAYLGFRLGQEAK